MVWYHHSNDNTLTLKSLYDLSSKGHKSFPFKPAGLWLSLDDEWYELQTEIGSEKFVKKIQYKYEVTLKDVEEPNVRILVLDTVEKLQAFDEKYKMKLHDDLSEEENERIKKVHGGLDSVKNFFPGRFPDWEKVCEDYDGMICTNYGEILMSGGLIEKMHWWSWLDINCACVWRPSKVVKSFIIQR
jgi:hypothetical protein